MQTTTTNYADQIRQMQREKRVTEKEALCQKIDSRIFGIVTVGLIAIVIAAAHALNPELVGKVLDIETYSTTNVLSTIKAILPILS